MPFEKTNVELVPIWIKLPGLTIKYWGERSLFKMASLVGKPVKMDNTMKDRLNFARVMVEVQMKQELPEEISFCNEHGIKVVKKIEYEWRPTFYKKCFDLGHTEDVVERV